METPEDKPLPRGIIRSTGGSSREVSSLPTTEPQQKRERAPQDRYPDESFAAPKPKRKRTEEPGPGIITAIEPQERHKDRVNIYIDGKFAMGLFEDVAVALSLKPGQTVTPERLAELADAELRRKAREDAYRLLSFRARTEKEIADRLKRREYEEEIIADTLRYLKEQHLLNDADFAARFMASRSRTHGDRAIAMELRQKGVAAETIAETLEEAADDEAERETVRTLAVKRVGERPSDTSPQAKARLWSFLARRGFSSDTIRAVLGELYGKMPAEE